MVRSCIMAVPLLLTHLLYRWVLVKKFTTKQDHLPYLTTLVPCYFWLLPERKTALKGHIFSDLIITQGHGVFKINTCSQQLLCLFMYSFQQHFSLASQHIHFYNPFPILFYHITVPMHCSSLIHCSFISLHFSLDKFLSKFIIINA